MSLQTNNPQTRELTQLEQDIIAKVTELPKQTVEDYASEFGYAREFYYAIQYLIWNSGDLKQDLATGAITPKGM